jgi:hypothetical protein
MCGRDLPAGRGRRVSSPSPRRCGHRFREQVLTGDCHHCNIARACDRLDEIKRFAR